MSDYNYSDDLTDAEWAAWVAEWRAESAALLAQAQAEQPDAGWAIDQPTTTVPRWLPDVAPLGELRCEVPSPGAAIALWATRPRYVRRNAAPPWVVRVFSEPPGPEHRAATLADATTAAVAAERARRESLARAWLGLDGDGL